MAFPAAIPLVTLDFQQLSTAEESTQRTNFTGTATIEAISDRYHPTSKTYIDATPRECPITTGQGTITLVASDAPGTTVDNIRYRVTFSVTGPGGSVVDIPSKTVFLPHGAADGAGGWVTPVLNFWDLAADTGTYAPAAIVTPSPGSVGVAELNITGTPAVGDVVSYTSTGLAWATPAAPATPLTAEDVRDIVASFVQAGTGVTVTHDDDGNTLVVTATSTGSAYDVYVTGADATGATACNTQITSAIALMTASRSDVVATKVYTKCLRFPPGKFKVTDPAVFDTLTVGTSDNYRGLAIEGPGAQGKRATMLSFESTVTSSSDQRVGNLFRFVNLRSVTVRNLGFNSTNNAQSLFYLFCSAGNDGTFSEFGGNGGNNQYRFDNLFFSGTWKRLFGADGDTRANQNSEIMFTGLETANSLSCTDTLFRFGFPLYSAVWLSANGGSFTAGTFTVTVNGQTTGTLQYNDSEATIQAAIEGLSTVGAGNCTVTWKTSPTPGWIVRFTGSLLGMDTSGVSVTSATTPTIRCYRYTPQQSQFLNYTFTGNAFEYGAGNCVVLNMGGTMQWVGYNSCINGIGGGGGTWFVMENVSGRADDMAHLLVQGARFELRNSSCKVIDSYWGDVNKFISFHHTPIATPAWDSSNAEIMAFRSSNASMPQVSLTMLDMPGYITWSNTSAVTGGNGGVLSLKQMRFKAQTSPTGAVGGSGVIRVTGHGRVRWEDVVGSAGLRVTDQVQDI